MYTNTTEKKWGSSNGASVPTLQNVANTVVSSLYSTPTIYNAPNIYSKYYRPKKVKKKYAPNYYTDYNDPYAMNSFADVLFNKEAKKRRYGAAGNIPLVSQVIGAADVLWNNTIKPVIGHAQYGYGQDGLEGLVSGVGEGLKQAGINTLVNLGETADVIANPVKAVAIEGLDALGVGDYGSKYGGNIGKGLSSAMGISGKGRQNYDWDTGNFLTDMALEIASDPINWFTFGSKAAAKSGADAIIGKAMAEAGAPAALKKTLTKEFTNAFMASSDDLATTANRVFRMNKPSAVQATGRMFSNPELNKIIGSQMPPAQAYKVVEGILDELKNTVGPNVKRMRLSKDVYGFFDKAERELIKSSLYSSGFGFVNDALKKSAKGIKPLLKHIEARPEKLAEKVYDNFWSELHRLAYTDPRASIVEFMLGEREATKSAVAQLRDFTRAVKASSAFYKPDELSPEFAEFARRLNKSYEYAQLPMDPITKTIYKHIAPIYKTGFLSTVGFPARNTFAGLINNADAMGGLERMPKAIADFNEAADIHERYTMLLQQMMDFGKRGYMTVVPSTKLNAEPKMVVTFNETVNNDLINAFYKAHPELQKDFPSDEFFNYHLLVKDPSSPLSGMTEEVRSILNQGVPEAKVVRLADSFFAEDPDNYHKFISSILDMQQQLFYRGIERIEDSPEAMARLNDILFEGRTSSHRSVRKKLLKDASTFLAFADNPYDVTEFNRYLRAVYPIDDVQNMLSKILDKNPVLSVNERIERALRWSMYKQQRSMGLTHGEAIQKIIDTHFVYDNKPLWLKEIETYFPFTGFTLKNYKFWDDKLNKNFKYPFSKAALKCMSYEDFIDAVGDVAHVPVWKRGKNTLYNEYIETFTNRYIGQQDSTTQKQFFANFKHFVEQHIGYDMEDMYISYRKSLKNTPGGGHLMYNIMNLMTPVEDFDSLSNPDQINYESRKRPDVFSMGEEHPYMFFTKGMEYQLANGNIRFGEAKPDASDPTDRKYLRSVLKVNPPWMDAFNFATNPAGSVSSRLLPFIANALARKKDIEDGTQYRSDLEYVLDAIPFIGTTIQRYKPVENRMATLGSPLMLEPSLFGTVTEYPKFSATEMLKNPSQELLDMWYGQYKAGVIKDSPYSVYVRQQNQPSTTAVERAMGAAYGRWKRLGLSKEYSPYAKSKSLPRSITSGSMYQDLKKVYSYNTETGAYKRPGTTYYRQEQRVQRLARPSRVYKDLYTSKGLSRMQLRMGKLTTDNLKFRVSDIQYMLRKHWYYVK